MGSVEEVDRAFDDVDTDKSGKIDLSEFKRAIMNSRAAELSLSVILTQMDGELEGLEHIFAEYKRKLEESKAAALAGSAESKAKFEAFLATVRRRRVYLICFF